MRSFKSDVEEVWRLEDEHEEWARQWSRANFRSLQDPPDRLKDDPNYNAVRERVAKGLTRALDIASQQRVPVGIVSHPPPAIAGAAPTIQTSSFEIVLKDRTYRQGGIPRQDIKDDLNRTVGAVEDQVRVELRHVRNPAWWLWMGLPPCCGSRSSS